MINKISEFCTKIFILIPLLFITILILYQNFRVTNNNSDYFVLVTLILIVISTVLLYNIKKVSAITLEALILLLAFVIRLVFIIKIQTPIQSDFALMYDAAIQVAAGNFKCFESTYFQRWAYQTPFVLYEAMVLKVCHSVFIIKFLNICYMVGTNFVIFLIVKIITNRRIAVITSFFYAVYPAPVLLSSVLTNQHISTFMIYLGVYLMIRSNRFGSNIGAGAVLGFGNLMRPEGITVLVSVIITFIIISIKHPNTAIQSVKRVLVLFLSYIVVISAANGAIVGFRINQNGISNQCPEWKFVVGLDSESNGKYTEKNASILSITDSSLRKNTAINMIKDSFQSKSQIIKFIYRKNREMWASYEDLSWALNGVKTGLPISQILFIDKAIYIYILFLFLLTLSYLVFNFKKEFYLDSTLIILIIMIFVNYWIYMFIEIQTRYRYNVMPSLFIASSVAYVLLGKISGKKLLSVMKRKNKFRDK